MKLAGRSVVLGNGETVTLRSPTASDAHAVLAFVRQLVRESYRNLNAPPDWFDDMTADEEAQFIGSALAAPAGFLLTAFAADGAAVGNLMLTQETAPVSGHCAQLAMGILAQVQHCGLGTALIARCLDEARRVGISNIRLTVRTYNTAAIGLYEKMGFVRVGRLAEVARIDDQLVDEFVYQQIMRAD